MIEVELENPMQVVSSGINVYMSLTILKRMTYDAYQDLR